MTEGAGTVGRLLGAGRTADVYELDEAWVLRRDRGGHGDALTAARHPGYD